jgi:hypothetical protein
MSRAQLEGQYPNAPSELLISMEADLYPRHRPERSDLIDASELRRRLSQLDVDERLREVVAARIVRVAS